MVFGDLSLSFSNYETSHLLDGRLPISTRRKWHQNSSFPLTLFSLVFLIVVYNLMRVCVEDKTEKYAIGKISDRRSDDM